MPSAIEARAALFLRSWLTPPRDKTVLNPVTVTPQVLANAREHFADHCASCHGNDGSGKTAMGQALYPKAPGHARGAHAAALRRRAVLFH